MIDQQTAPAIVTAARYLADTVERGVAAGLPEPFSIHAMSYAEPQILVESFEAVEAWADYCGVRAVRRSDAEVEFCDALVEEPGGFVWKISANRRAVA